MIGKPEIIRIAGQVNLNPHVVEKDYALGWLLAGYLRQRTNRGYLDLQGRHLS